MRRRKERKRRRRRTVGGCSIWLIRSRVFRRRGASGPGGGRGSELRVRRGRGIGELGGRRDARGDVTA